MTEIEMWRMIWDMPMDERVKLLEALKKSVAHLYDTQELKAR